MRIRARACAAALGLAVVASTAHGRAAEHGPWKSFGVAGCAYTAPTTPILGEDGSVDVVFHFHAGQLASRELRATELPAVIVACGWGTGASGTGPYARAFERPERFDAMLRAVVRAEGATRVGKLALAAWSAGFASIGKLLRIPHVRAMTDAVLLMDGLHAAYDRSGAPDARQLAPFVSFAQEAAGGERLMVVTHSAIVPPGYASTTETAAALVRAATNAPPPASTATYAVDARDLHVRGFGGKHAPDHEAHLHMIGALLDRWLVLRWKRDRRMSYNAPREAP